MKQSGFTLLELLLVIAIIGIMSSMAVVNLGGVRDDAKIAVVQRDMASYLPAVALCHDNGNKILDGQSPDQVCHGLAWKENAKMCDNPELYWPDLPDMDGLEIKSCLYYDGYADGEGKTIEGVFVYTVATPFSEDIWCDDLYGCRTALPFQP